MDHEKSRGAALLQLLHLLWLLPLSWTALQGMTAPPRYFHSEGQEPREPVKPVKKSPVLLSGGRYCGLVETNRIGERRHYEWTANDVRGALYVSFKNLLKQRLVHPFYR